MKFDVFKSHRFHVRFPESITKFRESSYEKTVKVFFTAKNDSRTFTDEREYKIDKNDKNESNVTYHIFVRIGRHFYSDAENNDTKYDETKLNGFIVEGDRPKGKKLPEWFKPIKRVRREIFDSRYCAEYTDRYSRTFRVLPAVVGDLHVP